MPPLGVYGNGGAHPAGCSCRIPGGRRKYRNTLFTGDWGRSEVYKHELKANGATFDVKQELFMKMPRATGMDIDGSGRLYVASWRGGSAVGFEGPNVGFVARVTPKGFKLDAFPDLKKAQLADLIKYLRRAAIRHATARARRNSRSREERRRNEGTRGSRIGCERVARRAASRRSSR